MLFNVKSLAIATLVGTASAQSFCDKYTTALFMNNTGANQLMLLTAVVNTVVIGNYSATQTGQSVPGILANFTPPGSSTSESLAHYFDGSGNTTNRNGMASKVNFLDGGGAAPLMQNKAAADTTSNQYTLITHLYEAFGALLGCTAAGFPAYQGNTDMYAVHQYMGLSKAEIDYFIGQVAATAAAYGVSKDDITAVGGVLVGEFDNNCSNKVPLVAGSSLTPAVQGMCLGSGCTCTATATASGTMSGTMSATGTATSTTKPSSAADARAVGSIGLAAAAGVAVAMFVL